MNNNPAVIKANLDKAIEDLAASPEIFSKNPKSDFTRSRKLPVSDVLRFSILMERDSVGMELLKCTGMLTGLQNLITWNPALPVNIPLPSGWSG